MKSVVLQHPGLCLVLAVLIGMILEWFLEMFFFRRRLNEAEAGLQQSERDLSDTKFVLSRTQSELRSKHDLLEATQKSRAAADSASQARDKELAELRLRLAGADQSIAAAEERIVELAAAARARDADFDRASQESQMVGGELRDLRAEAEALRLGEASTEARLASESSATSELRGALTLRDTEAAELARRVEELEGALAAQASVAATLQAAVLARDKSMNDVQAQLAGIEAERESVAHALAAADGQIATLKSQASGKATPPEAAADRSAEAAVLAGEVAGLKAKLAKAQKEAAAARSRSAPPPAAAESEKELIGLRERNSQLQDNLAAAAATRKELERELGEREQEATRARARCDELEEELQAARKARAAAGTKSSTPAKGRDDEAKMESLMAELETMSRERNELAAELAALKAAQPAPARRARSAAPTETGS